MEETLESGGFLQRKLNFRLRTHPPYPVVNLFNVGKVCYVLHFLSFYQGFLPITMILFIYLFETFLTHAEKF